MPSQSSQIRHTKIQSSTAAYSPPNLPENRPCPRCDSIITKFCYYNNSKRSQPRYFCKSCRRYWTQGGNLRDIPFGGGNRRSSSKRHRYFTSATDASSPSCSSSVITTMTHESEATINQGTVTTEGSDVLSGCESFASLLGGESEGALGSGSVDGSDYGFEYGLEEMSIGYLGGQVPVVNGGGDTWQIGDMEGKSGDSLIWPGLEFSMQSNDV